MTSPIFQKYLHLASSGGGNGVSDLLPSLKLLTMLILSDRAC